MHLIPAILVFFIMLPLALPKRGNAYFARCPSDGMQCLHCGRCTTIHQRFTELIIRDIQPERIDEEQTIERVCTNHSGDCVLCRWNNHYQYPDRQIARYVICRTGCFGCHPNAGVQGYDTWLCGAGIQLSANDMLRPGDWITMSKYGADGTVIEVTLNAIKVRNFDNTITTIPPYALVSDSFQNWRGDERIGRAPCEAFHQYRHEQRTFLYTGNVG